MSKKKKKVQSSRNRERAIAKRRQQQMQTAFWIAGGVLVVVAIILLIVSSGGSGCGVTHTARMNQPMDDFKLKDIDGNTVQLSDYRGKTVLVNFWATWCPPCKLEMPTLKDYYEKHKDDGFVILAIDARESLSQVREYAYGMKLTFPVLLDEQACAINGFGISSFPTSIIVGPDGVIKKIHIGMFEPDMMEEEVTPLLP